MNDPTLQVALAAASIGWRVFPVDESKRPAEKGWQQYATTDEKQIRHWRQTGAPYFAVKAGRDSGVFLIDDDRMKHGLRLFEPGQPWPDGPVFVSKSGLGLHRPFRYPSGWIVGNSVGALAEHVDVRGQGNDTEEGDGSGYFVLTETSLAALQRHVPEAPLWLLQLMHSRRCARREGESFGTCEPQTTGTITAPSGPRRDAAALLLGQSISEGLRDTAALLIGGALAHDGWPLEDAQAFVHQVATAGQWDASTISKKLKDVRSTFVKFEAGDPVRGWASLEELFGSALVAQARELLEPPVPTVAELAAIPASETIVANPVRAAAQPRNLVIGVDVLRKYAQKQYNSTRNAGKMLLFQRMSCLADGTPFAEPGEVKQILPMLCTAMRKAWKDASIDSLADLFNVSLGQMAGYDPPVTREDVERAFNAQSPENLIYDPDHVALAEYVVSQFGEQSVFVEGSVYSYEVTSGIWRALPATELSVKTQALSGMRILTPDGEAELKLSAGAVRGIVDLTRDRMSHGKEDFFAQAPAGLAFRNGFVGIGGLLPHSTEHRVRHGFDFDFVPGAQPAELLMRMREWFAGDKDCEQKIQALREMVGVSMLGAATRFQRAMVLVGEGSNGKSVMIKVIEGCMPEGSICQVPPQTLSEPYKTALFAGRLLNLVSELPRVPIGETETWKSLVSGDATTARPIREAPFTLVPKAGHIYSANVLPGTSDNTHAFWRRWIAVRFDRRFGEDVAIPELEARILQEKPAIVSWFLEGGIEAYARGKLTVPDSSRAQLKSWRTEADDTAVYLDERTEPGDWTPCDKVFDDYVSWCDTAKVKVLSKISFGRALASRGLRTRVDKVRLYPVKLKIKAPDAKISLDPSYAPGS